MHLNSNIGLPKNKLDPFHVRNIKKVHGVRHSLLLVWDFIPQRKTCCNNMSFE